MRDRIHTAKKCDERGVASDTDLGMDVVAVRAVVTAPNDVQMSEVSSHARARWYKEDTGAQPRIAVADSRRSGLRPAVDRRIFHPTSVGRLGGVVVVREHQVQVMRAERQDQGAHIS